MRKRIWFYNKDNMEIYRHSFKGFEIVCALSDKERFSSMMSRIE